MRISDWSSDVCSSDLKVRIVILQHRCGEGRGQFWSTGKASAKPFCNQQSDRTLLSVKPISAEKRREENDPEILRSLVVDATPDGPLEQRLEAALQIANEHKGSLVAVCPAWRSEEHTSDT